MMTRLVSLLGDEGRRRLVCSARGEATLRRPMKIDGCEEGDNNEEEEDDGKVACWSCSSCGRILALATGEGGALLQKAKRSEQGPSLKERRREAFSSREQKVRKVSPPRNFCSSPPTLSPRRRRLQNSPKTRAFLRPASPPNQPCRASPRPSPPSWPRAPWRRSARAVPRPRGEFEMQRAERTPRARGVVQGKPVIERSQREKKTEGKRRKREREAFTLSRPLAPTPVARPRVSSLLWTPFGRTRRTRPAAVVCLARGGARRRVDWRCFFSLSSREEHRRSTSPFSSRSLLSPLLSPSSSSSLFLRNLF